jgi:hypothetical protein
MIRIVGVVVVTLLMCQSAAQELKGLIEQNINSQKSSTERHSKEPTKATPQLWIHVRSEEQKRAVQGKIEWFRSLAIAGQKVEVRPIQVVNAGPQQSELRFFRRADQTQAQALLAEVKKGIPPTVLKDMSSQYQQVGWIGQGHYELWLGPNVTKFAPAR